MQKYVYDFGGQRIKIQMLMETFDRFNNITKTSI